MRTKTTDSTLCALPLCSMKKCGVLLLILITSLFTLTACGNSKYVGKWEVVSLINQEGTETRLDSLSSTFADASVTMTLQKDGTARLEFGDTTSYVQWEESSSGIIVSDNENSTAYTFKDDCLYYDFGQGQMKLEKTSDTP